MAHSEALKRFNGHELDGRQLKVSWPSPRARVADHVARTRAAGAGSVMPVIAFATRDLSMRANPYRSTSHLRNR